MDVQYINIWIITEHPLESPERNVVDQNCCYEMLFLPNNNHANLVNN